MLLKSLILAGVVQVVFLILVLRSGKKRPGNYLLTLWLVILSFQLLFYYDNLSPHPLAPHPLALLGFALPLLSSPVLFLYIYSLVLKPKKIWPHTLPYAIYCCVLCFTPVTAVNGGYPHFAVSLPIWFVNLLYYLLAIIPAAYAILTLIKLWYLERQIAFSFLFLFIGLFGLIRVGAPYGLIGYHYLFNLVGAILALYVFFIGYYTLRPPAKPRYQNSGLSQAMAKSLFERVNQYMQDDEPFLREDFTLDILADRLDIPSYQLSQAINQTTGANFFSWLNTYRVEAVKSRLTDPAYANYSIMGIAYDCGFSSKSSFNKVFKEITGETPSVYQNRSASR